jgi:hypothetical protein
VFSDAGTVSGLAGEEAALARADAGTVERGRRG